MNLTRPGRFVVGRVPLVGAIAILSLAGCSDGPHHTMTEAALSGPDGTVERSLVQVGSVWQYDDTGTDLGTSWRIAADDSDWATGPAPLGYGESYVQTVVSYGGDPDDKQPTTYFRIGFHVDDPADVERLYLQSMFDDGFVFYLNGHEGGRAWMPSGTITYDTLSSGHETGNNYMTFDVSAQIPNLVAGYNSLAVEVHQHSPRSSDQTMDFGLVAFVTDDGSDPDPPDYAPTAGGIPEGSTWLYDDSGADLGTGWRAAAYDDSGWSAGVAPLGFGEPIIATETSSAPITTYFRHEFTFDGGARAMTLEANYDDGFVAYLNGTEIARASMADGAVEADTLAWWHEADGLQPFDVSDYAHLVVDGTNVLAVEVHQSSTTSSDLVWDGRLTVIEDDPDDWRPIASGTDADLNDVAFVDRKRGFAVGAGGTLLETVDGGETWTARDSGTTEDLHDIEIFTAELDAAPYLVGYIVGDAGTVLHTEDGGVTWTSLSIGTTNDLADVGVSRTRVAAIVEATSGSNALYLTEDGGDSWAQRVAPDRFVLRTVLANSFARNTPSFRFGGMGNGTDDVESGVIFTADLYGPNDDDNWRLYWEADDPGRYPMSMTSYIGRNGSDLEPTWLMCGWRSLHLTGDVKVVSHDYGGTWQELPYINQQGLNDCAFNRAGTGYGVGVRSSILVTDDGGDSWSVSRAARIDGIPLNGVDTVGSLAWAVGDDGVILKLDRTGDCFGEPVASWSGDARRLHYHKGDQLYATGVTWELVETVGCIDHYRPTGGDLVSYYTSPGFDCVDQEITGNSHEVAPEDGYLTIDRSVSPWFYRAYGTSPWEREHVCYLDDGTERRRLMTSGVWLEAWGTTDGSSISGEIYDVVGIPCQIDVGGLCQYDWTFTPAN